MSMSRNNSSINKFKKYKKNPYEPNLIIPQRNKTVAISNEQLSLFDQDGVVVSDNAFIGIRNRVDKEKFVKIFKAQIKALFSLSMAGIRVFGYIMDATRISESMIFFSKRACKKYTGYSSTNSVNVGVSELLEKGFIARSEEPNIFFINPAIFFNGDRMTIVNQYIKIGSETDKKILENDPLKTQQQLELEDIISQKNEQVID